MPKIVSDEQIKDVLLSINSSARKYFRNMIEIRTGIDPANVKTLDLETSIHFLKYVWGMCLEWGNQRVNYIERSIQRLCKFLNSFNSKKEIQDLQIFLQKLEEFPSVKPVTSTSPDDVVRLTELLPKFDSVRIKTAALIMRFLCLDCSFFDVDRSKLIPPLDRVNYRMCEQLFGKKYTMEGFGRLRGTFDKKATLAFDDLGKTILDKNKVLIDNLWFIGHFYHDGTNCNVRQGAKIIELPYLHDVELQASCPFWEYGCARIDS